LGLLSNGGIVALLLATAGAVYLAVYRALVLGFRRRIVDDRRRAYRAQRRRLELMQEAEYRQALRAGLHDARRVRLQVVEENVALLYDLAAYRGRLQ
jgi:hypothetical protein